MFWLKARQEEGGMEQTTECETRAAPEDHLGAISSRASVICFLDDSNSEIQKKCQSKERETA